MVLKHSSYSPHIIQYRCIDVIESIDMLWRVIQWLDCTLIMQQHNVLKINYSQLRVDILFNNHLQINNQYHISILYILIDRIMYQRPYQNVHMAHNRYHYHQCTTKGGVSTIMTIRPRR